MIWKCGRFELDLSKRPLIMGILNVTPDSFSDGYPHFEQAKEQAETLIRDGADIVDIGGESTRPGSDPVSVEVELARVIPIIEYLTERHDIPISIDTQKAGVARKAVEAGAHIINHVSASLDYRDMASVLADHPVGYVAMHMRARPKTMQDEVVYSDVVDEVTQALGRLMNDLESYGVPQDRILLDPGIGFGKKLEHNIALLKGSEEIAKTLGRPILMGLSRKSWLTHLLDDPVEDHHERDLYTMIASVLLPHPAVSVHRVHNVRWLKRSLEVSSALVGCKKM